SPLRRAGGRRENGAGESCGESIWAPADPAAVLRGVGRGEGSVRMELQEAVASDPGGLERARMAASRTGHLRGGVPAVSPPAHGDPLTGTRGPTHRRSRSGGSGDRGSPAGGALGLAGV